jgi:hypothetical protein
MKPNRKELADEVEKQMTTDKADVTQIRKLMASQQAKRQSADRQVDHENCGVSRQAQAQSKSKKPRNS